MSTTKKESLATVDKEIVQSGKIDNNTFKVVYEDGSTAIRLHYTDVILSRLNDTVTFNSGGWSTPTTKDRINTYTPTRAWIEQKKGLWYIHTYTGQYDFYDGITFDLNGNLISQENQHKDQSEIKKKISHFVKYVVTKDNLMLPNNSDCWDCLMKTTLGRTLGDIGGNHDHLVSHMREDYLPGSLWFNAILEKGYSKQQIYYHYQLGVMETIKRAVREYMNKRLIK